MALAVRLLTGVLRTGLVVLLLGVFSVVHAENISGVVKDPQGGVLLGVSIAVRNVETGLVRSVTTGASGRYDATNLPSGTYDVEASLAGFRTTLKRGVALTVGRDEAIDFVLEVGDFSEEVVVIGGAPLVETTSAAVSGLVDDRAIRDLPLVSRSFAELITLHAGTSVNRTASPGGGGAQGFATQFSIAGQRATSTKFYQDGTELQGSTRELEFVGSAAGVLLGVDAIKEFRVLTSSYSPEYGKKAGGHVLTVTKSGTNERHGSLFEFYRTDALDATNFFAVGKDPFKRNNFGGSVGGPIVRNQSFFFANYEGLRQNLSTPFSAVVPDENTRKGFLPDGAGNLVNVGVHPAIAPYLNLWPLPNTNTNFGDGTAAYEHAPVSKTREDYFLGKVDHEFSPAQSIFASYSFSDAGVFSPGANPYFGGSINTRDQRATVEHKLLASSQMVNILRFGFSRSFHSLDAEILADLGQVAPGIVPTRAGEALGRADYIVSGLIGTGGTQGGTSAAKSSFQLADHASYSRGRHSFDFGGEVQRTHMNENPSDPSGTWDFQGLTELLTLQPRRFRGGFPEGATGVLNIGLPLDINYGRMWRQTYVGLYLRDRLQWDNLTLDLGLRYEVLTSPREVNSRVSNFVVREVVAPYARVLSPTPEMGDKIWPTDYRAGLAPRLGVTWDPFRTSKTVVRAGYGRFYDQIDNEFRFFTHLSAPFSPRVEVTGASARAGFPNPFDVISVGNLRLAGRSVDAAIQVPTVTHFSVGIQQQLAARSVVSIGYVGARGSSLVHYEDTNLRIPELVDGQKFWRVGAPVPQPLFGQWVRLVSTGRSAYDALQVELETRFGDRGPLQRLRSKMSYTFSKSRDDGSILTGSSGANDDGRGLDPFDQDRDWAVSSFDLRHRISVNFTYSLTDLPLKGLAATLVNNWQVSGIATATSGFPINLLVGFNASRDGKGSPSDRPNLVSGGNQSPVLGGPDHYFDPSQFIVPPAGFLGNLGRNTLVGPGLVTFDLSLVKLVRVAKGSRLQFRAEAFNVFNRSNFGVPSRNIFDTRGLVRGTAGRITETSTANRQMQLGLRLEF